MVAMLLFDSMSKVVTFGPETGDAVDGRRPCSSGAVFGADADAVGGSGGQVGDGVGSCGSGVLLGAGIPVDYVASWCVVAGDLRCGPSDV